MNRLSSFIIAAAIAALPAAAQVEKEITVEREIVPTIREASRLTFTPTYQLPAVAKPTLTYSERTQTARIPALFSLLEPAAIADSIPASLRRGYISAGYFPLTNAGLSAGYRVIDAPRTRLDAWLQYDGRNYDIPAADLAILPNGETASRLVRNQDLQLGLRIAQLCGRSGHLDFGADYALSHFNNPFHSLIAGATESQSANRVNVDGLYTGKTNDLGFSLGAAYGYFGFARGIDRYAGLRPVREHSGAIKAALFAETSTTTSYRLDIDASILSRGKAGEYEQLDGAMYPQYKYLTARNGKTSGLVTLTPSYTIDRTKFHFTIGARVDLAFNDGKFFHIAPDVKATWTPSPFFALYGRAGGGEHRNTMASLFAIDRYISPVFFYDNSHIPVEAEAGFRVGPFRGASLGVSAAYAVANDWLMPYDAAEGAVAFCPTDVRGWKFTAKAEYSWRGIAAVAVEGTLNPVSDTDITDVYYTNFDHARYVLDASLTVRPLRQLEVTAGYNLRASRSMRYSSQGVASPYLDGDYGYGSIQTPFGGDVITKIGNLANLRLGASWTFTPTLSAFVRLDNILNRHTPSFSLIASQGFSGLFGVTFKF